MAIFDEAGNYVDPSPYAPIPVFGPVYIEVDDLPGRTSWFQAFRPARPIGYRIQIPEDLTVEFDQKAQFLKIGHELTPVYFKNAAWGVESRVNYGPGIFEKSQITYPQVLEFAHISHDGQEYSAKIKLVGTPLINADQKLLAEVRPAWKDSDTRRGTVAWILPQAELSPFLLGCLAAVHFRIWTPFLESESYSS